MSANKGGRGEQESRLQNWIEHELVHQAMNQQQDEVETELPDRNISLRIPVATHLMLSRLALKLGRSKTACAEEIVVNAVWDVYRHFDMPDVTHADLEEYAAYTEKTPPESIVKRGSG